MVVLLGALVVVARSAFGTGVRSTSLIDLDEAIRAGRVQQVTVVGALGAGATGFTRVEVQWQEAGVNPLRRVAVVAQASDQAQADANPTLGQVIVGDVASRLRTVDPTLQVTSAQTPSGQSTSTFLGFTVPTWVGVASLLVGLGAFLVLVSGPDPWWGTRWAWFWFIASPLAFVTVPLFLAASGSPPGVPQSGEPGRRLGGVWAFFLASGLSALVGLKR